MTSTLKADVLTSKTTNGDLTISGDGSGVPDLEAGFKVGSVAGVPTASIRDDAVTLAKMASGTDGQIITYDASGNPTAVGPGSDGEVLTSTGAGSPPAFEAAAGGGAWTFLNSATASASATLTVTGIDTSTYDTHAIIITGIRVATDATGLQLLLGDSGGLDAGASDYDSHYQRSQAGGSGYTASVTEAAAFIGLGLNVGGNAEEQFCATLYLHSLGAVQDVVHGTTVYQADSGLPSGGVMMAHRDAVITTTQCQIKATSGNLTSGRMQVYGIAHS